MRWIYISPHLDDAVLSTGGFLYEQAQAGIPVEIWTIVCGFPPPGELTPFAQVMHFQWGTGTAEETVNLRRAEDLEAARIVGAKTVHFDIPDCIYRRGPDGEPLYLDIFVQPHEAEAQLPDQIAQTIAPHLQADDQSHLSTGDWRPRGSHPGAASRGTAEPSALVCSRRAVFVQTAGGVGSASSRDERIPASHNGGRLEGLGRGGAGLSVTIKLYFRKSRKY